MTSNGSLETGISGQYQFAIGEVLQEAWAKTSGAKLTIILALLAYMGVVFVASLIVGFVFGMLGLGNDPESVAGVMSAILQQLVLMVITLPLGMGLFMLGLKRSVDQPLSVGSIFDYFGKAVPLLLTALLMYVMLIIGFLLLILPGIYLSIAYYLAMPLVVEKNLGPWQALEASRKAITKRWFAVFGFMLLFVLINIVAVIPLGIGLIWTLPMSLIAYGILYRNVFGCESARPAQ
jgi:uncharacterized membrane protein